MTFDPSTENNENKKKTPHLGLKSVNIKFSEQEIQFDPGFTPLSCEIAKIEKSAQLGLKSVNIKFTGHEIQVSSLYHVNGRK